MSIICVTTWSAWSAICGAAFEEGFAKAGEGILITAGVPLGSPGATNMIRIAYLDDKGGAVAE